MYLVTSQSNDSSNDVDFYEEILLTDKDQISIHLQPKDITFLEEKVEKVKINIEEITTCKLISDFISPENFLTKRSELQKLFYQCIEKIATKISILSESSEIRSNYTEMQLFDEIYTPLKNIKHNVKYILTDGITLKHLEFLSKKPELLFLTHTQQYHCYYQDKTLFILKDIHKEIDKLKEITIKMPTNTFEIDSLRTDLKNFFNLQLLLIENEIELAFESNLKYRAVELIINQIEDKLHEFFKAIKKITTENFPLDIINKLLNDQISLQKICSFKVYNDEQEIIYDIFQSNVFSKIKNYDSSSDEDKSSRENSKTYLHDKKFQFQFFDKNSPILNYSTKIDIEVKSVELTCSLPYSMRPRSKTN